MSKLKRTIESYDACIPMQVVGGSPAQALYFVADAKADIATLAAENERLMEALRAALPWMGGLANENEGVTPDYLLVRDTLAKHGSAA